MEAMVALYIVMFLITALAIGIVYLIGKRRFGVNSDHYNLLMRSIRNFLRIISVVGLLSIFLINTGKIPPNAISFLCIPFFIINSYLFGTYFKLAQHHTMTHGKHKK